MQQGIQWSTGKSYGKREKGYKNNMKCDIKKLDNIKELIGINLEPLQNDDYSFLKAINTMIIEYVNAKYGEE